MRSSDCADPARWTTAEARRRRPPAAASTLSSATGCPLPDAQSPNARSTSAARASCVPSPAAITVTFATACTRGDGKRSRGRGYSAAQRPPPSRSAGGRTDASRYRSSVNARSASAGGMSRICTQAVQAQIADPLEVPVVEPRLAQHLGHQPDAAVREARSVGQAEQRRVGADLDVELRADPAERLVERRALECRRTPRRACRR